MRKSWKYADFMRQFHIMPVMAITCMSVILLNSSCNTNEKHKHISANKAVSLDGLSDPVTQTVFSEVKTISPVQYNYFPILSATGIISYDPRLQNTISSRFSGRIEKLYVHFNYEDVKKGQRLMDIYSPEILTEQHQYILLIKDSSQNTLLMDASRKKLLLLGLTNDQLMQIEKTGKVINPLPVYSPYSGHIHDAGIKQGTAPEAESKSVMGSMAGAASSADQMQTESIPSSASSTLAMKEGLYLQRGQPVFSVYNTQQVWAILNIFPPDAGIIRVGDHVTITTETDPGKEIISVIKYIEPVAGQQAEVIRARVYLPEEVSSKMKIGSLLSAKITAGAVNGIWLPRTAVISLGRKTVVFQKEETYFSAIQIQTGIMTDSLVQVTGGLDSNKQVALNARFMVDSESFIQSKDDLQ